VTGPRAALSRLTGTLIQLQPGGSRLRPQRCPRRSAGFRRRREPCGDLDVCCVDWSVARRRWQDDGSRILDEFWRSFSATPGNQCLPSVYTAVVGP